MVINRRGFYTMMGSLFTFIFVFIIFLIIAMLAVNYGFGGEVITNSASANATTTYLVAQLGTSGLASWTPAVIAIAVGTLFISMFMFRKGL